MFRSSWNVYVKPVEFLMMPKRQIFDAKIDYLCLEHKLTFHFNMCEIRVRSNRNQLNAPHKKFDTMENFRFR